MRTGELHEGGRERVEREREHAPVAEVLLQALDGRHLVREARLLHTRTRPLHLQLEPTDTDFRATGAQYEYARGNTGRPTHHRSRHGCCSVQCTRRAVFYSCTLFNTVKCIIENVHRRKARVSVRWRESLFSKGSNLLVRTRRRTSTLILMIIHKADEQKLHETLWINAGACVCIKLHFQVFQLYCTRKSTV